MVVPPSKNLRFFWFIGIDKDLATFKNKVGKVGKGVDVNFILLTYVLYLLFNRNKYP